jgi:hypothetical protein
MFVILTLRRLRQKDQELEAILGYTVRPCLKKEKKKTNTKEFQKKAYKSNRIQMPKCRNIGIKENQINI